MIVNAEKTGLSEYVERYLQDTGRLVDTQQVDQENTKQEGSIDQMQVREAAKETAVSHLTDSLTGIVKENYDLDEVKAEIMRTKYGFGD